MHSGGAESRVLARARARGEGRVCKEIVKYKLGNLAGMFFWFVRVRV
jgi:hypothetical protein